MAKYIWSNTSTMDYLLDLDPDELRNELGDLGYDMEMLEETPDDELKDIVYDNVDMFDGMDMEDWEYNIVPELNKQTQEGIVIQLHEDSRRGMGGKVDNLEDVLSVDYDAHFELMADDDNNVYMVEYSHDVPTGTVVDWYTYPKDTATFVSECLGDLVQEK